MSDFQNEMSLASKSADGELMSIDIGVETRLPSIGGMTPDVFDTESGLSRGTHASEGNLDIFDDAYNDPDMDGDESFDSRWNCPPYKEHIVQDQVNEVMRSKEGMGDRKAQKQIVERLNELGVEVFVLRHDSEDMYGEIQRIVNYISNNENTKPTESERCLLFRDRKGRLFNLLLKGDADGLASLWFSSCTTFSGVQALAALTVLSRVFGCVGSAGNTNVGPGFLSIILGLALMEEISHVLVNISMQVRGTPSISAHALSSWSVSDWPRKLIVLILALATVAENGSDNQHYLTVAGTSLAFLVLAANIGAKAWQNLRWNPVKQTGILGSVISFVAAVVTGLALPYFGFGGTGSGGKSAMETMLVGSLIVAVFFGVSDLNYVQDYILVGSEQCDQDVVNMATGAWWTMTLITCLNIARRLEPFMLPSEEEELLLIKDHSSPVGMRVPNLPGFCIDPTQSKPGVRFCTDKTEFLGGIIMAVVVGGLMVLFSFLNYQGYATPSIVRSIQDLF
mmetsp:Transcript_5406/g.8048  ORF Transcript_5406/g.8048 Transcript_5406/m.8048 type:complete len:509 (+) Transcript_5406:36-1562(+)